MPQHVHLTILGSTRRRGGLVLGAFEHVTQCRLPLSPLAAAAPQQHAAAARRVGLSWAPPVVPPSSSQEGPLGTNAVPSRHGLRLRVEVTAVRLSRSDSAAGSSGGGGGGVGAVAAQLGEVADAARQTGEGGRPRGTAAGEDTGAQGGVAATLLKNK
jgi:hypothetical protein